MRDHGLEWPGFEERGALQPLPVLPPLAAPGAAAAEDGRRAHLLMFGDVAAGALPALACGLAGGPAAPAALALLACVPVLARLAGLYRAGLALPEELRGVTGMAGLLGLWSLLLLWAAETPPEGLAAALAWGGFVPLALLARARARLHPLRGPAAARPRPAESRPAPLPPLLPAGEGAGAPRAFLFPALTREAEVAPASPWVSAPLKRGMDIAGALAGLVLAAPLMLAAVLALALAGGPVFYVQSRVGRAGRRFGCLKFRTMQVDAAGRLAALLAADPAARAEWARHQKLAHDPRVTRIGRVLRRFGLDELPQLVNVLRGEMSLVGPRPVIAPEEPGYPADRAYAAAPGFAAYQACRPGLSGLWQVSGGSALPYSERMRLDARYRREAGFWLDLAILWATAAALRRNRPGV
ncbi:sugar transferase [Oceanicella sp. SM1341]|uniref:sugar transferase n=1 Tax=Oceanicella sp. SM1341 TaxID=1548889 RepID=UPI002711FCAF|nr:sugar transferase [Oceanicella sp. SM1341]